MEKQEMEIIERIRELDNGFIGRKKAVKVKKCEKSAKDTSSSSSSEKNSFTPEEKMEIMADIAKRRCGEFLSDEYNDSRTKYKFRCHRGHEFYSRFSHVYHLWRWCSKCVIYVGEEITRRVMEILFQVKFEKIRPDWLDGLELDGYNDELKIAFEYDGPQHFKFFPKFHKTIEKFHAQQERDKKKDVLCSNFVIKLIRIPYNIKYCDIKEYICTECVKLGINIPNNADIDHRDFDGIYYEEEKYERLKKDVELMGLKLISEYYVGVFDHVILECTKGHRFESTPECIRKTKGCTKCKKAKRMNTMFEIIKKDAIVHNCECISAKYHGCKTLMKFRCNEGHVFELRADKRKTYKVWCNICRNDGKIMTNTKKGMYQKVMKIAEKHGGKCISSEYKTRYGSLEFECAQGHRFTTSAGSLISNNSWCHACKVGQRSIEDMKKIAEEHNGICLSKTYKNLITNMEWKCNQCGHKFIRRAGNIINRGIFCSICK